MLRRIYGFVLSLAMMLGVPTSVIVGNTNDAHLDNIDSIITNKTEETLNCNEYKVTYTFALPEAKKRENIDIILILDKSSVGSFSDLRTALQAFLGDALFQSQESNINYKIGVIWFDYNVHNVTEGLVPLTQDVIKSIFVAFDKINTTGTNIHGAVNRAKEWLDDDAYIDSDSKYVVIFSDLAGYLVDDGTGTGLSRFALSDDKPIAVANDEMSTKYTSELDIDIDTITSLIADGKLLNGINADMARLMLEEAPEWEYPYQDRDEIRKTADADLVEKLKKAYDYLTPDMPTMFEKSIYQTGNVLLAMKESGYTVNAVTKKYYSGNFGSTIKAFQEWFSTYIGARYDYDNPPQEITLEHYVQAISRDTYSYIGKGTLSDLIPEEFEIVMDSITVMRNDSLIPNKTFPEYPGVIFFYDELPEGAHVPLSLEYKTNNENQTELLWNINTTLNNIEELQISYIVRYKGALDESKPGEAIKQTNLNPCLKYVNAAEAIVNRDIPTGTIEMQNLDVAVSLSNCKSFTGTLKTQYITADEVLEETTDSQPIDTPYTTVQKEFAGYTFKEMLVGSAPISGFYGPTPQIVTYVYTKDPVPVKGIVTVRYVDESNNNLTDPIVITDPIGSNYTTTQKNITGYTFMKMANDSAAVKGQISESLQSVTYVYKKDTLVPALPQTGILDLQTVAFVTVLLGLSILCAGCLTELRRDRK